MKKTNFIKNIIVIVLAILIFILIIRFKALRSIASLLVISFILSYPLKPLKNFLVKNNFNERKASLLIVVFLIGIIIFFFGIIIPKLVYESENFAAAFGNIADYIGIISNKINTFKDNALFNSINNEVYGRGKILMSGTVNKFIESIFSIGENMISICIIPVIVYYFLCEEEKIYDRLLLFVPSNSRDVTQKIMKDINKILTRYVIAQLMLSVLITCVTFIILIIYKIKFPLLLALLNGIFNIIPYFGPVFGALPIIFAGLLKSPTVAVYMFIWMYILQLIEGNIISPKITGDSVNMHPFIVIILLIFGGEVGGLLGMLLVVPIGVMVKVIYEDLNYYMY